MKTITAYRVVYINQQPAYWIEIEDIELLD